MNEYLIQPINDMTVTATFLNTAYRQKFGFEHYGVDCVGSPTIYAQGNGVVIRSGRDNMYGNYVSILYELPNITLKANYFHMNAISVNAGKIVTKDTSIGIMGNTGTYSTGTHLHTEFMKMNWDVFAINYLQSPYKSDYFMKIDASSMIDPLSIMCTKKTAPDNQSLTFLNSPYVDKKEVKQIKE